MFVAFLSNTPKQYVTSYSVASVVKFRNLYATVPNTLFISAKDFQGQALTNFIQNYYKYFLQNGKLVLDTTK